MLARHLDKTFAVIKPGLGVDTVDAGPDLYAGLIRDYEDFRDHALVACHSFSADWPTWERHRAGDKILVLLSGTATLIVRTDEGDKSVALFEQGDFIVVPKDSWHTAKITEPTVMLTISPGGGTENLENPE